VGVKPVLVPGYDQLYGSDVWGKGA
jgi:hypothetical protein